MCWKPASWLDNCHVLLPLTTPIPLPNNSVQCNILLRLLSIQACLQEGGPVSHVRNQIALSEGFLLISWTVLRKWNCCCASPPEALDSRCATWCYMLGCEKAGLSSEAERWIILITDFYIKIQNLEVCSTCYFTQFCTLIIYYFGDIWDLYYISVI